MFFKKKYLMGIVLLTVLIVSFKISYETTLKNFSKGGGASSQQVAADTSVFKVSGISSIKNVDVITEATKINFKVEYKKAEEIVDDKKTLNINTLIGKDKKALEDIYAIQGYTVTEMDSNHVILVKSYDRYAPNKYVIDIFKDSNCVAIFKTDDEGRESIENPSDDIKIDTKISDLKAGDVNTMTQGKKCLQFDNKEAAEENYKVIFKT